MAINLENESPITLAETPHHVPKRNGKRMHYSTVYRWVTKGVRGRRLESLLVGGVRYTTIEALRRFLHSPLRPPDREVSPSSDLTDAIEESLRDAGV